MTYDSVAGIVDAGARMATFGYNGKSVTARRLVLEWTTGTVVLQLSAEKFGQWFHRPDVGANTRVLISSRAVPFPFMNRLRHLFTCFTNCLCFCLARACGSCARRHHIL